MAKSTQAEIMAVTDKQEKLIDESMEMGLGKYANGMNMILTRIIEASLEVEKDPKIKKSVEGVFLPVQEALSRAAQGYEQVPLVEMEAATVTLKRKAGDNFGASAKRVLVMGGKKSCGLRGGAPHCFNNLSANGNQPTRAICHVVTIITLSALVYYAIPALARLPGAISRFLQGAAYLPTLCTGDLLSIWWTNFMATWYSHWFPGGNAPIGQTCVQRMAAWVSLVNLVTGIALVAGFAKLVKEWWKGATWRQLLGMPGGIATGIYRCVFNGVLAVLMVFTGGHVESVDEAVNRMAAEAEAIVELDEANAWQKYNEDFYRNPNHGGREAYMAGWKAVKAKLAAARKGGRKTRRHKRKSRKTKSHKKRSSRRRHKKKTSKGKKARKH